MRIAKIVEPGIATHAAKSYFRCGEFDPHQDQVA